MDGGPPALTVEVGEGDEEVGEAAALLGEERGDAAGEVGGVVHEERVSCISLVSWNARGSRWERFAA